MRRRAETEPARRRVQVATRSRWVRVRIHIAAVVLGVLLCAIGYQAYAIQIANAEHYRALARRQHLRTLEIPAPRGVVYDTRGRELAVTVNTDSIFASPRQVRDVSGTAEALAGALGLDVRELEADLGSRRSFVWIARRVTPDQADAVKALKLAGIELTVEPRRFYPSRSAGGPVIGFANIDGHGLEGVERSMNDLLEGKKGELAALRDARGRVTLEDGDDGVVPGASVFLTLDRSIQYITERALAQVIEAHHPHAAVAVVLEIGTGRVLAMASSPTYDPNLPGSARGARNRAITDVFEVGSVMKAFTVAGALDAGVIRPDQTFDIHNGSIRVGHHTIRDSHRDKALTVGGIIKRSSNVGAIKIAQKLGAPGLHDALQRFHFAQKTDIELPGERAGVLRPAKRWTAIGLATAGFGMGFSVTPLQVVSAYAAIGNGGIYHRPRIIREVRGADGQLLYQHHAEGERIMAARTAGEVLQMLGTVFEKGRHGGTAHAIDVPGYRCGGKTGTAQKLDPTTGRYGEHLYVGSFVGVAPLADPRIAVLVLVDQPDPENGYYGAEVAAPAWATIVSESLRYLGVPEDAPSPDEKAAEPAPDKAAAADDDAAEIDEQVDGVTADLLTSAIDGVSVPDFRGLGVAQAMERAARSGLQLEVVGTGRAVTQSPDPGVPAKGAKCRVVFAPGYR